MIVRLFAATIILLFSWPIAQTIGEDRVSTSPFVSEGGFQAPNLMIILADDLGFSDLGCYGGEIETPNLDQLASHGLRFTQFYNTGRCWPTRAALMTGYYAQQVGRDKIQGSNGGMRGSRPNWAPLLSARLKKLGYRSYLSGKWHIDGQPLKNGFDRSFRMADHGRFFSPKRTMLDDKRLPEVSRGSGYYSTTEIANRAIEFLEQHESQHNDQPFFHFVTFTAPHFPLHALPEDIEKYHGKYDQGWNKVRAQRWHRIQRSGLLKGKLSNVETGVGPPYHFADHLKKLGDNEVNRPLAWESLSESQKSFQAKKMEIHAAMVDRMDQEIGRIIHHLKTSKRFDNTLILFLSDNGASAEIMVRDDGHDPNAAMGSAASHLCLGPGWSSASNTPFRRHKTWVHEGGIRTPLIAHWPKGIQTKNELRTTPAHVIDLVPTLMSLAGAKDQSWKPQGTREMPGESLVPVFQSKHNRKKDTLWWSHDGHRAIRKGKWKLVSAKNESWELFDMEADPGETNNLFAINSDVGKRLVDLWQQQSYLNQTMSEDRE